ncbi:hypothetical protein GKQ51_17675 [Azotobacter chroococcum]|uniref:Uncharacterized protein n=1 Tax=Azotobacter chroococcum TaxID=353 RepID=A0AAP9YCJ3_9GAMM|nr:hypothetical protein GKQ51_17675 [Azotobacter chroococcum]
MNSHKNARLTVHGRALLIERMPLNHWIGAAGNVWPKRLSTASSITSRTSSSLWPWRLATQLMAYRSQQSRAKVARRRSPSSQRNSKPSEHQRVLLVSTATRPSWRRAMPGCLRRRSSSNPWSRITRREP